MLLLSEIFYISYIIFSIENKIPLVYNHIKRLPTGGNKMKFSDKFISATKKYTTFTEHIPAPLMRKSFQVSKQLDSADLTISGLGFYKLYINGKEIKKGLHAPYI